MDSPALMEGPVLRQTANPDEISKVWSIITIGPTNPILLRAIAPRSLAAGRPIKERLFTASEFPDVEARKRAFERAASKLNGLSYNVYMVMNVIRSDFELRRGLDGSVGDADIVTRTTLLVDIDRASKVGCPASVQPASVQEVNTLKSVARDIRNFLIDLGWPPPIRVFSGNGFHLYWGLESLPNNDEVKVAIRDLLHALAAKFDTVDVAVDTCVYNASRITKVPGTMARKGVEAEGRRYQLARVLDDFVVQPVSLTQIRSVTSLLQQASPPLSSNGRTAPTHREPDTPRRRARLAEQLAHISADCEYKRFCDIVWAILSTGWPNAPDIAREWSLTAPDRYEEPKFQKLVDDYDPDHERPLTLGTITKFAREGGWHG